MRDILHTPYALGGREIGAGLDCLGVVNAIAARRGLPPPDGWPSIRAAWERGELATATGFPAGWRRQWHLGEFHDGDVLLYHGPGHPWAAIVHAGCVWSSSEDVGSAYCMPVSRWRRPPDELWRFGT